MKFRPSALIAAFFGVLFLFSLAGCPNTWIEDLLNFKNKSAPGSGSGVFWTVTFDSNGGSDVASQPVGEGEMADEPNAPTKLFVTEAGLYRGTPADFSYTFAGWYIGDILYDFNTPVTEDITLTAKWAEPAGTSPHIDYDTVPANDVGKAISYLDNEPYTLLLDKDVTAVAQTLSVGDLTIIGIGAERTIQYYFNGDGTGSSFFTVNNANASLTLGNNITLRGISSNYPLVNVTVGTLTMKAGSKITGHTNQEDPSGAVCINGTNAIFVMDGGEISGNKYMNMSGAGGVNLCNDATFVMSGGKITDNYRASGTRSDVLILNSSLTLSGTAEIHTLKYTDSDSNSIIIGGDYNGSVAVLSLEGSQEISALIKSFENKPIIQGGSGHTLSANDISKFKLVYFFSYEGNHNRSITGNAIDSGNGNYALDTIANIGKLVRVFARGEVLTDVDYVEPYLLQMSEGGNVDAPVPLNMKLDMGTMTSADSNWQKTLAALSTANKFVDLDLSRCTMSGTAFNPVFSVVTGKNKIVDITLPTVATSIAVGTDVNPTFCYFTNLKTLNGPELTAISNYAFYGNLTNLTTVSMPKVTSIGNSAFYNCWELTATTLPTGLQSIGANAFMTCQNLELTSLPAGVTEIKTGTFHGCTSLTEMTLHAEITKIDNQAFQSCANLATVTCLATTPPTLGNTVFSGTHADLKIYVPAASVDAYKSGWSTYKDIIFPIGGTESINITVEQIKDESPSITGGTISRTGAGGTATSLTLNAPTGYTNYVWTIDGVGANPSPITLSTNYTATVSATNVNYNSVGNHPVYLLVTIGGVQYSKTIMVKIAE